MTMRRTCVIMLTLLVGGCGFFSRTKNTYYSLTPLAAEGAVSAARGTPAGVGGIELPPGLDRSSIVVRKANHGLDVRGNQLWTAPLEEMVLHTLAFDLAKRAPEGMIVLPGQAAPIGAMRSIYVTFEELAAGPDPVFVLDARFIVKEVSRPDITGHERITVNVESLDSTNVAAGMSRALATLADRIMARL